MIERGRQREREMRMGVVLGALDKSHNGLNAKYWHLRHMRLLKGGGYWLPLMGLVEWFKLLIFYEQHMSTLNRSLEGSYSTANLNSRISNRVIKLLIKYYVLKLILTK